MTGKDATREAVAKAFLHVSTDDRVTAFLAALDEAGYAVVKRQPTQAMIKVGTAKALSVSLGRDYNWPDYMTDMWETMLTAQENGNDG